MHEIFVASLFASQNGKIETKECKTNLEDCCKLKGKLTLDYSKEARKS